MRSFAESDIGRVYGHSPKKKQILDDCDSPTRLHRFREILHATALVFFFVDVALSHRVTAVAFSGGTKEEPCRGRGTVRSKLSMPCDRSREVRRSASGLLLLLLGLFPTGIRVVLLHAFGENFGLLAEILLVHDSIRANDK